jgi:hypothetical protein
MAEICCGPGQPRVMNTMPRMTSRMLTRDTTHRLLGNGFRKTQQVGTIHNNSSLIRSS